MCHVISTGRAAVRLLLEQPSTGYLLVLTTPDPYVPRHLYRSSSSSPSSGATIDRLLGSAYDAGSVCATSSLQVEQQFAFFWSNSMAPEQDLEIASLYEASDDRHYVLRMRSVSGLSEEDLAAEGMPRVTTTRRNRRAALRAIER